MLLEGIETGGVNMGGANVGLEDVLAERYS